MVSALATLEPPHVDEQALRVDIGPGAETQADEIIRDLALIDS